MDGPRRYRNSSHAEFQARAPNPSTQERVSLAGSRSNSKTMNLRSFGRSVTLIGCAWVLLLQQSSLAAAETPNLVSNGDFAQASNGQPRDWQTAGDAAVVTQELRVATAADGTRYAQLSCTRFERQTPAGHAMLAQVGRVQLVKGQTYEFSCKFRAEGIAGRSVSVAMSDTSAWQNCGLQTAFPLSGAWKTCRRIFRASRDVARTGRLQIWFNETGTLDVADVRIAECREENAEFTDIVAASGSRNLVPNPSFELGGCGWSSFGRGVGWGNLSRLHGYAVNSGGPLGRSFLRIPVGGDHTPVLYFDYYQAVTRREISPLAANVGWIKVVKGRAYTLSGYMRATRDDVPAVLGVMAREPSSRGKEYRRVVTLTTAWQRYSFTFNPDQRYVFVFAGPNLQREERVDVDVAAIQLENGDQATDFQAHQPLELALEPAEPGGIFLDDQPAYFWLRACNNETAPCRMDVHFRVTDFEDQLVALPGRALEIPARRIIEQKVELPRHWRGFYQVVASAEAGGAVLAAQARLAIVPRLTERDSVCGINHAFATAELIELASKAGVSWYRDWSLKWQQIEPAKGTYHWDEADVQIDRVLSLGCSLLPLLPPFPSAEWSSEAPLTLSAQGYPGVRARQAWAPKEPQELADFIERATTRYKDRIHIWEFLNEPLYTDYALPRRPNDLPGARAYKPEDYVGLLQTAAAAMRKADPRCKLIGGIAGGPRVLTREVLQAGILNCVDILNLHIYPGLRAPEAYAGEMDELLQEMKLHGGPKPIWITEFSYYGADNLPRRPFIPQPDNWAEERLLESERQCADYTLRFFAIMLSRGVEKIFIHSGANGAVNSPNFECALFDDGGTPRKLVPALAVLTHVLGPAPRCVGTKSIEKAGYVAGFETGKQAVLVVWRANDEQISSWSPPIGSNLTWMDAMGRQLSGPPAMLSSSLTYALAPNGLATELLERLTTGQ